MSDIPDFNQWHFPSDWDALKASGVPGVILRACSPEGEDAHFAELRRDAELVGLPWIAYHRPLPGSDPVTEADRFNAIVGPLPIGTGLAGDFENDSKSGASWAGDLSGWASSFLNGVGPADYAPLWYASVNFARDHDLAGLTPPWPAWLAHYNVLAPDLSNLPTPALWQYTNKASFTGVPDPCDGSRLLSGSFADLLYKGTKPLNIQWLGSPNYTAGRQGHDLNSSPSYVVLHTMVGTVASANSRFQNDAQQASAHYGIGYDGRVVQWVQEADTAYHAGVWEVNLDSVGIEHEDMGNYDSPRPDALYAASAQLVREICQRHGIPIRHSRVGTSGIIAHRETGYATACPDALDVDRIIRQAASGSPVPPEEVPNDMTALYQGPDGRVFSPLVFARYVEDPVALADLRNIEGRQEIVKVKEQYTIDRVVEVKGVPKNEGRKPLDFWKMQDDAAAAAAGLAQIQAQLGQLTQPAVDVAALAKAIVAAIPQDADEQAIADLVVGKLGEKLKTPG